MPSVRRTFKQVLAAVGTIGLVMSTGPPPSLAATENSHAASVPLQLPCLPLANQGDALAISSASFAMNPQLSKTKTVVPVAAANPEMPRAALQMCRKCSRARAFVLSTSRVPRD
jgi:hypothetical protein